MSIIKNAIDVIKMSFLEYYEYLFQMVFLSINWFLIMSIPLLVGYFSNKFYLLLLTAALIYLLSGPLFISGLRQIQEIRDKQNFAIKQLYKGIKVFFTRGLLASLISTAIYLLLIIDLLFFLQRNDNLLMFIIAVVFLYLIAFFSIFQLYFWSLLANNPGTPIRTIARRTLLLGLDNIYSAFIVFIITLILVILLIVTGFGLPIAFFALIGLISINLTEKTLDKYDSNIEKEVMKEK